MSRRYSQAKGRSRDMRYFGIPFAVTEHSNFSKLSAYGNKLLIDVGRQYSGANNGDLCATWSMMVKRGWKSRETLNDALRELEYYGLIVQTQYGDRKSPSLYALSWMLVDKAKPETGIAIKQVPRTWKLDKPLFVKPSKKRLSKHKKRQKFVTRNAGQTSTVCVSKAPNLRIAQ